MKSPISEVSFVAEIDPTSMSPSCDAESISPGYTDKPVPSIRFAPAGAATVAPTATILPSAIATEPFSMVAPETVTILAFSMTYDSPAAGSAAASAGTAYEVVNRRPSVAARIRSSVVALIAHLLHIRRRGAVRASA
ncbi:MAG: hypothetical protein IPF53_14415 [Blastocatellia bacterium]|nr:hypothetical protein [Blastocatellia bacterium]